MIIIMTVFCYKDGKFNNNSSLLQGLQVDNNKSDINEDKICLLLKR